jgi:hypothetical protein
LRVPCPGRAGQGKVTKIFKGQVAGYECHNLSTCDKLCVSDIFYIFSKVKPIKKKNEKRK